MKILWIVNMVLPELADYLNIKTGTSGTWMIDISQKLGKKNDIELAVACVYGKTFEKIKINNIIYYMLPGNGKNMLFYTKRFEHDWERIYNDFCPDIVHLHGTEYSHGLSFLRRYPNVKSVVSMQGVLSKIKNADFGGISPFKLFINRTLHENTHFNGSIEMHFIHKKNAKHEMEIIKRAHSVNYVNLWDYGIVKNINPDIKCFQIGYNLRDEFYSAEKWDINTIERHTVFSNPGGTPLKGIHILIKAMEIVKRSYPDAILKIPGFTPDSQGHIIGKNDYSKYVQKLIKKLDMEENVIILGPQTGNQMLSNMQKANVTVIPSAIEGTSLILREAMFIGCPCITSYRGGMVDFISNNVDGFQYDYTEYEYLAVRIMQLFEDDELCRKFSQNAIKKAEASQDREKTINDYMNMYTEIMER